MKVTDEIKTTGGHTIFGEIVFESPRFIVVAQEWRMDSIGEDTGEGAKEVTVMRAKISGIRRNI